jgi:(R)-2-hydroxyacyl-CoA dehydratese activating ATPase
LGSVVIGVDIGSTTAKAAVLNQQQSIWTAIIPSGSNPPQAGKLVCQMAMEKSGHTSTDVIFIVATGYGRVSADFANKTVTEIACHGRGAFYLNPAVRTIIDIGGQDAKAISLGDKGKVVDFVINDKCAAGTGRFLETAAQLVLRVQLEDLASLSAKATDCPVISNTCAIFSQTEMVSLLAAGVSIENIVAGLHKSIASRVAGMAKRVGIRPSIMMTGGVAKNAGMVTALGRELNLDIAPPLNLDPQLVGALGAAIVARELSISIGAASA